MSDVATTDRANYHFAVKEYPDTSPWICLELFKGPSIPKFADGFVGLELNPGTTIEQAQDLADTLNRMVPCVTYTTIAERYLR